MENCMIDIHIKRYIVKVNNIYGFINKNFKDLV
jgi:hypothetical protein